VDARGSTSDGVTIQLTSADALVLSDALAIWERTGSIAADDAATRRVMQDLTAVLEPVVDVAFSPDYADHLRRARQAAIDR